MAGYHPAVEQYLETIYELEESGITPLRARLVERLSVSAPSVSETVKRLEREGYLVLDDDRVMRLTDRGRHLATAIARRHRLAERLLVDVVQVPWSEVHEEAGRLEHAISDNLERHLVRLLGDPATCPHGNPIPGSHNSVDVGPLQPVAELPAGASAVVRRVDEELEARPEYMVLLEQHRLMPGDAVTVVEQGGPDGARLVTLTGGTTLPPFGAQRLYVSDVTVSGVSPRIAEA